MVAHVQLDDLTEQRGEQRRIAGPGSLQGMQVDEDVGQGVEMAHPLHSPHFRTFQPKSFGMAVAAFGTGALPIDGVEQRTVAVERDAHVSPRFRVEVFDFSLRNCACLHTKSVFCGNTKGQR